MMTAKAEQGWLDRPLTSALALDVEKLLYAAILAVAIVTRFYALGTRVMSHDESLHTYYSYQLYQGQGFQHTPLMHGPLQFHLIALTYFVFGDSDFTARVPAALFGVVAVGLLYCFRHWLGRTGALVAAALITLSPYMLYYSRYTRNEAFVVVWVLLMAWGTFRYMESRKNKWLYLITGATAFHYITKETSFIYVAIWLILLDAILIKDLLAAPWAPPNRRRGFGAAFVAGGLCMAIGAALLFYASNLPGMPPPASADGSATLAPGLTSPISVLGLSSAVLGVSLVALAHLIALLSFRDRMRSFPAFDLLIVLGTFVLPQLAAFPVKFLLRGNPIDYGPDQLVQTGIVFGVLAAIAVAIGLAWNWQVWAICAGIWFAIFIPFQTTIFTNGGGFWTGMVGSLGYWLEQQPVQRGSQPWYYYVLIQLPMYEFLPVIASLLALAYGVRAWLAQRGPAPAAATDSGHEEPAAVSFPAEPADGVGGGGNGVYVAGMAPALGFIGFWAVLALSAFTIAGEKMPWLTVHLTLPLILLSGWGIGRLIDSVDWRAFLAKKGWIATLLLPVLLISVAWMLLALVGNHRPFQGKTLEELQTTSSFLAAFAVAGIAAAGIYFAGRESDWKDLGKLTGLTAVAGLGLLTARAAFTAAYVNYDYANEYLVYAHSSTGVKTVMDQVEDISRRTTDALDVRVAYDDDIAWPMTWYMRRFRNSVYYGAQPTRDALNSPLVIAGDSSWAKVEPLLGDRYHSFEYIRMVWPMQEYFNLTPERVKTALTSPDYRQAIWDIWWNRDYKKYGELNGVDYSLARWPVVDRMRFYVRKDIAAQIWDYGVGPAELSEAAPEDPYAAKRQTLAAELSWGTVGTGPGQFETPRAVAVAPDGSVYVADTQNHRIQKFDAGGNFLLSFGGPTAGGAAPAPLGSLNEPWGIAVAPDGSVYVADTWNHRVQKFAPDGRPVTAWGFFGQGEAPTAFWGPRGIAVDSLGRVYVSDTGNKRVVVFDGDGSYLSTVGLGAGYEPGHLDEPVGVAIGPDGRLYVADTWNMRVQVFEENPSSQQFEFYREWSVSGWYGQSLDNKPYVTVDDAGRVYVSDPEGYRILVFDGEGNFITTWGDLGSSDTTFVLPAGLAAGGSGELYVVDAGNDRVMRFRLP